MNVEYSYTRKRSNFGRPCRFSNRGPTLVCDIASDPTLGENYVYKRFMDREVQNAPVMSANSIVMESKTFETRGMFHAEGGWPREVNPKDEDQIERFRKKVQRSDAYVRVMDKLCQRMEHAVLQNVAFDIYKTSLENLDGVGHRSDGTMNITYVCRPSTASRLRCISWRPDSKTELVVTMDRPESLIWNLTNPNKPTIITASSPMTCLKYSTHDNRLVSGMENGKIAIWDLRNTEEPAKTSAPELSHRDTVVSLLWTASKSGTEFFTAGADGMVKWWDCNKIRKPKNEAFFGVPLTCLEFDPNVPTKFLVGTCDGYVICGSRREAVLWKIKVSDGPVVGLARNPAFPKILLIIGGKTVKIWSEDCKHAALFWTAAALADILTAQWSPTRCSLIACGRLDNFIDVWDLSERRSGPLYSIRNGPTVAVTAISFNDEGKLLAVGTEDGSLYVYQISEKLTTITAEEKTLLSTMFDRENTREKLREAKLKEIQLKQRETEGQVEPNFEEIDDTERLDDIKTEYLNSVQSEMGMNFFM